MGRRCRPRTACGASRVYRLPRSRSYWYRLIHGDNVVEQLTIGGVQRLLAEAGVDLAELVDAHTAHTADSADTGDTGYAAPPGRHGAA